jgi:hypothetical protein
LLEWSYLRDEPKRWHRKSMYRALKRWGVNVGYGKWAPNADLMKRIGAARQPDSGSLD